LAQAILAQAILAQAVCIFASPIAHRPTFDAQMEATGKMARSRHGTLSRLAESEVSKAACNKQLRLVRRARQISAKQDALTKISDLSNEISRLRRELAHWEHWYCTGLYYADTSEQADEVMARLRCIRPVIERQVCGRFSTAAGTVCGAARAARNLAEHDFSESILVLARDGPTAKVNQRRRKPRRLVYSSTDVIDAVTNLRSDWDMARTAKLDGGSGPPSQLCLPDRPLAHGDFFVVPHWHSEYALYAKYLFAGYHIYEGEHRVQIEWTRADGYERHGHTRWARLVRCSRTHPPDAFPCGAPLIAAAARGEGTRCAKPSQT